MVMGHCPQRFSRTFVDIEHLAATLRHAAVEHLTRTGGASAVRVELVTQGRHPALVFFAHALVAGFVKDDAGIVAVVNDGVAHGLDALFPTPPVHVFFGIAGGHRFQKAHTVTRFHVLFPGRYVHPTHEVSVAFQA